MEVVLRNSHLTPAQVLRVFYATCSAVAHMHSQKPPIIHRDLKVKGCHTEKVLVVRLNFSVMWLLRILREFEILRMPDTLELIEVTLTY